MSAWLSRLTVPPFTLRSEFRPAGDQPAAIEQLTAAVQAGDEHVTLLGATGTGKTFTIAHVVEQVQRPTLVIAPNKSLAAQLANEFREVFPDNAVEYFVSYYDYYQPEAYIPSTDTYIEKDSSVNDEIERLRHSATAALLGRRDVLIVASVSCIYGLGSPEEYEGQILRPYRGTDIPLEFAMQRLVDIQYSRNNVSRARGTFRVQGDTLEVFPPRADRLPHRVVGRHGRKDLAVRSGHGRDRGRRHRRPHGLPGLHYATSEERMKAAVVTIEEELHERLAELEGQEQAARGRAAAHANELRPRDDARGRVLQRHRELLAAHRRSQPGHGAVHAARLLPRRLPRRDRRVARDRPADRRHVRGRPLAQVGARRARVPAAERDRQPPAEVRGVRARAADGLHVGHSGALRTAPLHEGGRADRAPTGLVDPEVQIRPTKDRSTT